MKKPTNQDILLDASLDFIMNSPAKDFDAYLRESGVDANELERKTTATISSALRRSNSDSKVDIAIEDPFAALTVLQLREIAASLKVRRNVLTAFRERRVILTSVPAQFFVRLASAMNVMVDPLVVALSLPPAGTLVREYKANATLEKTGKISFEQLLIEAGIEPEVRAELLKDAG